MSDRDAFYDYKLGIFYIRNKYRQPASKWFFTIGRLSIRKWWVLGPLINPSSCPKCGGVGALNDTPSHSDVWYRCLNCTVHTRMFLADDMGAAMKQARAAWERGEVSHQWEQERKV